MPRTNSSPCASNAVNGKRFFQAVFISRVASSLVHIRPKTSWGCFHEAQLETSALLRLERTRIKNSILSSATIASLLHHFMEQVYTKAGKRTKQSASRYKLSALGFGSAEEEALSACSSALAHQVTLSHGDGKKHLRWFLEVCDQVWPAIITQVLFQDSTKPHAEQDHEPLAFLSGRVSTTQLGLSFL